MTKIKDKAKAFAEGKLGTAFLVLCIFFFQTPEEITIIPIYDAINVPVIIVLGAVLVATFLLTIDDFKKIFKDNLMLVLGVSYVLVGVVSTIINRGYVKSSLWACGIVPLGYMVAVATFFKANLKRNIFAIYIYYLAVSVLNAISTFIFCRPGKGLPDVWGGANISFYSLVGNYNKGIEYVFIMILLGMILVKHFNVKFRIVNYASMVLCLVSAIFCESLTQEVAFGLIIVTMILSDFAEKFNGIYKSIKVLNAKVLCILSLIPFFAVVIFGRTGWMEKLGLDATVHGRGEIWANSITAFLQKPILGNGVLSPEDMVATLGGGGYHSHCLLLGSAFTAGIVGLIIQIAILVLCIISIDKVNNIKIKFVLGILFGIFFLTLVVEEYTPVMLFAVFAIYWYFSKNQMRNGI